MQRTRFCFTAEGPWRFATEQGGACPAWTQSVPSHAQPVNPAQLLTPWDTHSDKTGWYFCTVELPAEAAGATLELQADIAGARAEAWLGGQALHAVGDWGRTCFRGTPAAAGPQLLALRLTPLSAEGHRGLCGLPQLAVLPAAHITRVEVYPDMRRGRVRVQVATSASGRVHLSLAGSEQRVEGEPGELSLDIPAAVAWSTEEPTVYTLQCDLLADDGQNDQVLLRFGLREFTVKDSRFHLNTRPLQVRGVRYAAEYPAAPGLELEALRTEIEQARAAGFNALALPVPATPPAVFQHCDELGLLVFGVLDASVAPETACALAPSYTQHPALVAWSVASGPHTDAVAAALQALDATRVILAGSGPESYALRPLHDDRQQLDALRLYLRVPADAALQNYLRHLGDPNALVLVEGFGYDALAPGVTAEAAARQGFEARQLESAFGSFEGFVHALGDLQRDAIRFQVDALRANPKVAGYFYEQLADTPARGGGLLTQARAPKPATAIFQAVHQPLRPLIQASRTNLVPREELPVTVLLANDLRLEGRAEVSLMVIGPTRQVLWKKKRGVKIPKHGKELWSGSVAASGATGVHRLVVRLLQNNEVIAQASLDLQVVPQAEPTAVRVRIVEANSPLQEAASRLCQLEEADAPVQILPPLGRFIGAYPAKYLADVLERVAAGAVGLVFTPPEDWNTFAAICDVPRVSAQPALGGPAPVGHYARLHPVFDGLPSRVLARQAFADVVPGRTYSEESEEDIAGSFDAAMPADAAWGTTFLVQRHGHGRLVFSDWRILEHLGRDPIADRLFVNLVNHFGRRAVSMGSRWVVPQRGLDWLQRQQTTALRKWMVIGMFPNWTGHGHDTVYPPERAIELGATYPGWYRAAMWMPCYASADEDWRLELHSMLGPMPHAPALPDHGTAYAYAEFNCDKRIDTNFSIGVQHLMKVWLNGLPIFEETVEKPWYEALARGTIRQGKNTLLVKVSKEPGPFAFSIDPILDGRVVVQLGWWR